VEPTRGRFLSRVRLHEAVAMGRTTYEELQEQWGINIGPPGTPQAFARNEVPEHPYAYAANNPANYIDPSGNKWVNPYDPRWPRPAPYSTGSALGRAKCCLQHKGCIERAAQNTYAILASRWPHSQSKPHPVLVGGDGGPRDAMRHCIGACLARKTCGQAAYGCVNDHENDQAIWAKGHYSGYSSQDLANNAVGLAVSAQTGSCEAGCLAALKRNDLYIMPKRCWHEGWQKTPWPCP
jgi:hypothetical protein